MVQSCYMVIGAAGGIGSAICRGLWSEGCRLVLSGRDADALRELSPGGESLVEPLDATRFDEVASGMKRGAEWGGGLQGVVNCAGSVLLKPAHLTSQDECEQVIQTNLVSAFATVRAASQVMRADGGSIVLFASAAAQVGIGSHEAIAAAKAGVIGLARSAAATYAAKGIRVNVIAPGLVDTPMTERITRSDSALQASRAMHPLGRIGQPDDIVPIATWLLSRQSSWVTGQVIGLDGGLSTVRAR